MAKKPSKGGASTSPAQPETEVALLKNKKLLRPCENGQELLPLMEDALRDSYMPLKARRSTLEQILKDLNQTGPGEYFWLFTAAQSWVNSASEMFLQDTEIDRKWTFYTLSKTGHGYYLHITKISPDSIQGTLQPIDYLRCWEVIYPE